MFPNSKLRIEMRRMCEKTPNSLWVFGHKLFSSAVGMLHLTLPSVLLTGDRESLCHRQLRASSVTHGDTAGCLLPKVENPSGVLPKSLI